MSTVIEEIAAERRRQIEVEGWTPEHDDEHAAGDLSNAAACYAAGRILPWVTRNGTIWPWTMSWWKLTTRRRDLIKAAALIVAEIERLDRATETSAVDCR